MNRLSRAVAALAAAGLAVPLWATPASAQGAPVTEKASSVAYFSSAGISKPAEQIPQNPPQLISDSQVDGVGPGNLGVGATANQESKVSFVFFSLSDLPVGATITKAELTMNLAPEDAGNRRMNGLPKNVQACMPGDTGFGGQDGNSLQNEAPARMCDAFKVTAAPSADGKAFVFDVSGLAATWGEVNDGVALTRTSDSDPNFSVVFTPDASLTYEFVAPPAEEELPADTGGVTTDLGGVASGGSTSFGGSSSGFGSGTSSTPSFGGGFDSAVAAPLTGAELPAAPAPETAGETPVVAQTRAAPAAVTATSSPTTGFWIAALLVAGALALLSLIMGDPRTPAGPASRSPSRLSQALSSARGTTPLLGARGA